VLDRNLFQANGCAAAPDEPGSVVCGADIADPVGVVAKHGDQVPRIIQVSDDDWQPPGLPDLRPTTSRVAADEWIMTRLVDA
jgi:hypothetical protein